jgi:hypothetical protein
MTENEISKSIIGLAINVHQALRPGRIVNGTKIIL